MASAVASNSPGGEASRMRASRTWGYSPANAASTSLAQSPWSGGGGNSRLRPWASNSVDLSIERYFAEKLNDFDLAANNGGWQWAASTGCDAQPWFRIFNPVSQSRRFDAQGQFIRRYLPQLATLPDAAIHAPWEASAAVLLAAGVELGKNYPRPVVQHDEARQRTLARFAAIKGKPDA